MDKIYTREELNEYLGFEMLGHIDKKQALVRLRNAGLECEVVSPPHKTLKFKIIKDDFHREGEEWRVTQWDEHIEVSNLGRVRETNKKRLIGKLDQYGYHRTMLNNGKNTVSHRLVFFAFHPELWEMRDKIKVDHIDGNRSNNRLDNLRGLTTVENNHSRDENQTRIKCITTELCAKFGYNSVENFLNKVLTLDSIDDIINT